ncbi:MAG: hypothetical protein Q8O41_07060 [Candidatus Methanoperedens sp.]|nr:hypothetical protein [Candidatus Methanoperedens sp.]
MAAISGIKTPDIWITFRNCMLLLAFVFFLIIEALKQKIPKVILSMVYRENESKDFSIEPFSYFISVLSLLYLSFFIDEKICFAAIATLAAGDTTSHGKARFQVLLQLRYQVFTSQAA